MRRSGEEKYFRRNNTIFTQYSSNYSPSFFFSSSSRQTNLRISREEARKVNSLESRHRNLDDLWLTRDRGKITRSFVEDNSAGLWHSRRERAES